MARVLANDAHDPAALNDLALVAHTTDAGSNLHNSSRLLGRICIVLKSMRKQLTDASLPGIEGRYINKDWVSG